LLHVHPVEPKQTTGVSNTADTQTNNEFKRLTETNQSWNKLYPAGTEFYILTTLPKKFWREKIWCTMYYKVYTNLASCVWKWIKWKQTIIQWWDVQCRSLHSDM